MKKLMTLLSAVAMVFAVASCSGNAQQEGCNKDCKKECCSKDEKKKCDKDCTKECCKDKNAKMEVETEQALEKQEIKSKVEEGLKELEEIKEESH